MRIGRRAVGTLVDVADPVVGALVDGVHWVAAVLWVRSRSDGRLDCEASWGTSGADASALLLAACHDTSLDSEAGVPGPRQAHVEGRTVWVPIELATAPYAAAAAAAGVAASVAVPVPCDEYTAAVLELFTTDPTEPSPARRAALTALGAHLASLARRTVAAEAIGRSELRHKALLDLSFDAVVSMDAAGRITEFSPAAEQLFGYKRDDVIGGRLAELLIPPSLRPFHEAGLARYLASGTSRVIGTKVRFAALRRDGSQFQAEIGIVRIDGTEEPEFLAFVRDTTPEHEIERALVEKGQLYADQARVLQASLLPHHLPVIPGIDLAVRYAPAGEDVEVGGDFYDVIDTGNGTWVIVLGDVEGKGLEAAAITALTRFTVQALTMRERSPGLVLAALNDAMLKHGRGKLCTMLFAVLVPRDGRLALEFASAGHPLPLLVRDGDVRDLGEGSLMLGVTPDLKAQAHVIDLLPGDRIVMFTDGLTEARAADGRFLGDAGIRTALVECAGQSADDCAATLESVARAYQNEQPRDDIGVIVLDVAQP